MAHIGQLIKQEMERQERKPTWLAEKISCDRTNVYHIYQQESLNTDTLERISLALRHNFFADLAQEMASQLSDT